MLRIYLLISYVIFLVMAFVHVVRLAFQADMTIGGLHIPMWVSVMGALVAGLLGYYGYHLWDKERQLPPPA
jgi:hypothetical protein